MNEMGPGLVSNQDQYLNYTTFFPTNKETILHNMPMFVYARPTIKIHPIVSLLK